MNAVKVRRRCFCQGVHIFVCYVEESTCKGNVRTVCKHTDACLVYNVFEDLFPVATGFFLCKSWTTECHVNTKRNIVAGELRESQRQMVLKERSERDSLRVRVRVIGNVGGDSVRSWTERSFPEFGLVPTPLERYAEEYERADDTEGRGSEYFHSDHLYTVICRLTDRASGYPSWNGYIRADTPYIHRILLRASGFQSV